MSLSYVKQYIRAWHPKKAVLQVNTYWNLLLGQDNSTVLSSKTNGHDIRSCDGLERIFYPRLTISIEC